MCGINGYYSYSKKKTDVLCQSISIMNELIHHRGPDSSGIYIEKDKPYSFSMGMQRLSIIDLVSGNQPMYSVDKSMVIIFNGEIYNYKELRHRLVAGGENFETKSDTEVILKLYSKYGYKSFSMLDGMYAICIYNKSNDTIILARDFFGEKPLHYFHDGQNFYFASELKSIVSVIDHTPNIDTQALNLFFQLTYIPSPFTIYEKIYKLPANHYLVYDCQKLNYYVNPIKRKKSPPIEIASKADAVSLTKKMVIDSVSSRSIADVPIGTFLSGGVDSSIVSLCLSMISPNPIETFSIGFGNKNYDETHKSKLVSNILASNHNEFILNEDSMFESIDNVIVNFDEPFADSSALPSYFIANKTSQKLKVVLTGDGGDEIFAGYNKYYFGIINKNYTTYISETIHQKVLKYIISITKSKRDARGLTYKLNRVFNSINYGSDFYYRIISLGFHKHELTDLLLDPYVINEPFSYLGSKFSKPKTINEFREIDRLICLEGDMLAKVDRTSMLNSLESRSPFLNKKMWDFSFNIPENFLISGIDKKHLLKEAFKEFFPKNFLNQPKKGFGVPIGDWLRSTLKTELARMIEDDYLEKQTVLFNKKYIRRIVNNHITGKEDNSFKVWTYYCFQKWYQNAYKY